MAALRAIVAASMAEAAASACLASPSLLARLRCLAQMIWPGDNLQYFPQNAFLTLAPGLYLKYQRRKR